MTMEAHKLHFDCTITRHMFLDEKKTLLIDIFLITFQVNSTLNLIFQLFLLKSQTIFQTYQGKS